MVDRGEHADREQSEGNLGRRFRQRGHDGARADADEEDDEHPFPAPLVRDPAGRNRTQSERDEARHRVGDERRVTHPPFIREPERRDCREDQHEEVIEEVPDAQEEEVQSIARHFGRWLFGGGQYAGLEAGRLPSGCARTPARGSREVGAGRGCGIHVGMARCHRRGFRALAQCRPEVGVPSRQRHLAVWQSGGTAFPRQLARGRRSPGSAGCGMVSQETGSFSPPTRSDGRRDAARAARTHTRRGSGGRQSPRFQRRARRSP